MQFSKKNKKTTLLGLEWWNKTSESDSRPLIDDDLYLYVEMQIVLMASLNTEKETTHGY